MSINKIKKNMGKMGFAVFFGLLTTAIFGCTRHSGGSTGAAGASADGSSSEKTVNLAIWGNYLNPQLIRKFEKDNGIKINISNYASNEELLAKVQAGAGGIDVAVPSDYMVAVMVKLDLLHKIDHKLVPNAKNLDPAVLHQPFDPENKYSLPYDWSTAGIAVNRKLYKGVIKGWHDVFNNPALVGKISLLDDMREVMAAALKYNGYSVNTVDPKELKAAEKTLLALKPRIKMFRSDAVDPLIRKEVAVAQSFSTDAMIASARTGGDIQYILPDEGGTKSIDNLVILKTAPHVWAAHKLINFMLSSDANVSFVEHIWGGPVLRTTRALLPAKVQKNEALFPPPDKLLKFEALHDLGENTHLYDDIWTIVKTE